MIESSPVIRDEVLGLESFKEGKRITASKVPLTKAWLPPGCMSDRKQSEIQASAMCEEMFFHQVCCITGKRSISSKEAGYLIGIYQIHVCSAPPAIDAVSVAFVSCRGSADFHVLEHSFFTRGDRNCVAVTLFP